MYLKTNTLCAESKRFLRTFTTRRTQIVIIVLYNLLELVMFISFIVLAVQADGTCLY